jgi:hypothetical protein
MVRKPPKCLADDNAKDDNPFTTDWIMTTLQCVCGSIMNLDNTAGMECRKINSNVKFHCDIQWNLLLSMWSSLKSHRVCAHFLPTCLKQHWSTHCIMFTKFDCRTLTARQLSRNWHELDTASGKDEKNFTVSLRVSSRLTWPTVWLNWQQMIYYTTHNKNHFTEHHT